MYKGWYSLLVCFHKTYISFQVFLTSVRDTRHIKSFLWKAVSIINFHEPIFWSRNWKINIVHLWFELTGSWFGDKYYIRSPITIYTILERTFLHGHRSVIRRWFASVRCTVNCRVSNQHILNYEMLSYEPNDIPYFWILQTRRFLHNRDIATDRETVRAGSHWRPMSARAGHGRHGGVRALGRQRPL